MCGVDKKHGNLAFEAFGIHVAKEEWDWGTRFCYRMSHAAHLNIAYDVALSRSHKRK